MTITEGPLIAKFSDPKIYRYPIWTIFSTGDPSQCVCFISSYQSGNLEETAKLIAKAPELVVENQELRVSLQ